MQAVVDDEVKVDFEFFPRLVLGILQLLLHRAEVHGVRDDLIVAGNLLYSTQHKQSTAINSFYRIQTDGCRQIIFLS